MKTRKDNAFTIVEVLIAVVVIALLGFLGWKAWDAASNNDDNASPTSSQVESSESSSPVNNEKDLDAAAATLDETVIDDSESTRLETETNF